MIVRAVKCQPFQLAVSPPASCSALELYCAGDVTEDQKGVDQKEAHMSGRLIAILVSLATLTSAAFALTITRSTFLTSDRIYSTSADFDQAFAQLATAVDPESIAANREKIRKAGLERLNLEQP
jgi:hypothetical protein